MIHRPDIAELARAVLVEAGPAAKADAARRAFACYADGDAKLEIAAMPAPPDRPARPDAPILTAPGDVKKRGLGSSAGRVALLHALAHIEFNAIDLAFDMALRFAGAIDREGLDARTFFADWLGVGGDEARHFLMVERRLGDLGSGYGALPAHDGLWRAAADTADDVLARLAIAPMVLEARGLDVTPQLIAGLERVGDSQSAEILQVIYREEVRHVAVGVRWFEAVCASRGEDPETTFRALVRDRFAGDLKPPFNIAARDSAGFARRYYAPPPSKSGIDIAV